MAFFSTSHLIRLFTSENLMYHISEFGDILYIFIYNEISGIHYSLILKNMSLLVLLLVTKVSYFIISPLVKLRYLNK